MASVLDEIVKNRKRLLDSQTWLTTEQPSERSMYDSIRASQQGLIFECKRKSPSRGMLAQDYHPDVIARKYADYASGISVLTEPDYFAGEDAHLLAVRQAVDLPILAKDFVVDLRQINHARALGANCILLMMSVVNDDFWLAAYERAKSLNMAVLTEVHDEAELQRAIELDAPMIGINNRDLHSLKTDLDVTRRLAPLIPSDRIIISESGIASYEDLRSLSSMVHGYLIGTSMMQSSDLSQALRSLIFSEVKVCGLTNSADAKLAYDSGATWGGVIMTPQSKRYQTPEQAATWMTDTQLPMVGVFMDQSLEEIISAARQLEFAAVQLHGSESPEFIASLRQQLSANTAIWKTITASDSSDDYPSADQLQPVIDDWMKCGVAKVLVDKPKHRAHDDLDFTPLLGQTNVMIAGGIKVDSDVLKSGTRRAGIDICSGVESEAGKKDPALVKQLFDVLEVKTRHD